MEATRKSGHTSRRWRGVGALALAIGVAAGLVVGGAVRGWPWHGSDGNAASAVDKPAAPPSPKADIGPAPAVPSTGPLKQGRVVANDAAGELSTEVAAGRDRSLDGAVAAFTSYAVWLIGSPAAAEEPAKAAAAVGGALINPTDARLVADMQRAPTDRFQASRGAYRVLGRAGSSTQPDQVMVEVTAPLTIGGKTRWRTIGGVVGWSDSGWKLVSIKPVDVAQPAEPRADVRTFSERERTRTLAGLGWQAFRFTQAR